MSTLVTHSSFLSRFSLISIFSALSISLNIIYGMAVLYVNFFFAILYLLALCIGIFFGNILIQLFDWKKIPQLVFFYSLFLVVIISFFLFPFTHQYYNGIFFGIRFTLLALSFIGGILSILLVTSLGPYFLSKRPIEVYIGIIISIALMLILQIYSGIMFSDIILSFLLFIMAILCMRHKILDIVLLLTYTIIFGIAFWVFQFFSFFFVETPGENKTRIFDMGLQVDFKMPIETTKDSLDLSSQYEGELPTKESIYINGRFYGQLIEDSQGIDYAAYTPYQVVYSLKAAPKVLILRSSGGGDVYLTHKLIDGEIDALERNQEILNQIRDTESLYVGGIYHNRNTLFYRTSTRPYIGTTSKSYDILSLKYQILNSDHLLFLSEEEQTLSQQSFKEYFRILSPQGLLFINIKTFSQELNEAILLKAISTFKYSLSKIPNNILDYIHIFKTPYSLNLIISKSLLSEEQIQLFNQKITELNYSFASDELNKKVSALITENKNLTSQIPFSIAPIKDEWNNWLFPISSVYQMWENGPYSFYFIKYVLIIIMVFGIIFLLLSHWQFQKTNLYKLGLSSFFPYFLFLGLAFGLAISFSLNFFNYFLSSEIIAWGWAISTILFGRFFGEVLVHIVPKFFYRIIYSLLLQVIINISLLFVFILAQDILITLPLVWKIIIPTAAISLMYIFITIPITSGFYWVFYMQAKEIPALYSAFFLGVIIGISFGSYIIFGISSFWAIGINIILLCMALLLVVFLDKRSKEIDYLYSKNRI